MNRASLQLLALSIFVAAAVVAQPLPLANDVIVNATVAEEQIGPDIAADAADDFRLVWYSQVGDPLHWDVRIRRLAANGAFGSDSLLSTTTTNQQRSPAIDLSDGGDWAAIWSSDQDSAGTDRPLGKFTTFGGTVLGLETAFATSGTVDIGFSGIAAVGEDSMVGVWRNDGDGNAIQANFRDRTGVQFGVTAVATSAAGAVPEVAGLYGDHWVATWHATDADAHGAYFRCFSLGSALEPGTLAHAAATGDQTYPAIASNGGFQFVVVWQEGTEIRGRLFGIDGLGTDCFPVGNEFAVSDPSEPGVFPEVDMAADGAFVVTWYSAEFDADNGIVAREFTKAALPVGPSFAVNSTTLGAQGDPAVAISAHQFAVAFSTPDSGAAGPRNVAVRRFARRVVFTDGFESDSYWDWSAVTP